jgi:hypothetical protein
MRREGKLGFKRRVEKKKGRVERVGYTLYPSTRILFTKILI